MHHKGRDLLNVDFEGRVFEKRESDIDNVLVLPQTFDDEEHYVKLMRAAILFDWSGQKELKKSLIIKNIPLDFIESDPFDFEGEVYIAWTVVIPTPRKIIPEDESNIEGRVAISDPIIVMWDKEAINGTKLPTNFTKMKGKIRKIDSNELIATFKLPSGLFPPDHYNNVSRINYTVTFLPSPTITERKLQAVDNIWIFEPTIRSMILGTYNPSKNVSNVFINHDDHTINSSQHEAISKALTNEFTFIQGPPGCGKTHVIAAIVYQALIRNPNERILVCGPTNISIENLVFAINNRIRELGKCIVWSASRDMDFSSFDNLTELQKSQALYWMLKDESEDGKEFRNKTLDSWKRNKTNVESFYGASKLRNKLEKKILDQFSVVCCTLVSSGKRVIRDSEFSIVIIDEATQSYEAESLIPLTTRTEKYILVGDQKQLGPNIISNYELKSIFYDISLFDRLVQFYQKSNHFAMLGCQYRMHPKICDFPNKEFYNSEIKDGVTEELRNGEIDPVSFIDVKGNEVQDGTSYSNYEEADEAMLIVDSLIRKKIKPSQIGIITPYGSQSALIRDKLCTYLGSRELKVASVDSFQGNERDYIIVSITRTNSYSLSEFFLDKRRVNVTLTRAKFGLIIIGNFNSFRGIDNVWGKLCVYCDENKYVRNQLTKIYRPKKEKLHIKINRCGKDPFHKKLKGLDMTEVPITITRKHQNMDKLRVFWPDNPSRMEDLSLWVGTMKDHLDGNKQLTLVVNANSICMQICCVFNRSFDLFAENVSVPNIGRCDGVIIMFFHKDGMPHSGENIQTLLNPLLNHPNVTLIVYDLTNVLSELKERQIHINPSRLIDVQLSSISENKERSNDTILVVPLRELIRESECSDKYLLNSKEWVNSEEYKNFPFEYNDYIITYHNLPLVSMMSEKFMIYIANEIPLIALVCKNILRDNQIGSIKSKTLELYHDFYKEEAPKVLRLARIIRPEVTNIFNRTIETFYDTKYLLKIWSRHKDFIEIYNKSVFQFKHVLRIDPSQISTIIRRFNRITEIIGSSDEHLGNVYAKSKIVQPENFRI